MHVHVHHTSFVWDVAAATCCAPDKLTFRPLEEQVLNFSRLARAFVTLVHTYTTPQSTHGISTCDSMASACFNHSASQAFVRARGLSFLEFLEAFCRVCDMISPPPPEQLVEVGATDNHPTTQYYTQITHELGYLPDRPSAAHCAPKTRPLDAKVEQVIEWLGDSLLDVFSAKNQVVLLTKLRQRRGKTYQLGKSAM